MDSHHSKYLEMMKTSFSTFLSRRQLDHITVVQHHDKIAASGEGRKPDLDRQKYMVESELAILSILYKLIIIIS